MTELEHFTYRFGPPPFITPESTIAIDARSYHQAGSSSGAEYAKGVDGAYARLEVHLARLEGASA